MKTRCQASRCVSELTESADCSVVSGRQRQNPRAAWWPRRPRVTSALPTAAGRPERAINIASDRSTPPALHFAFPLLLLRRPQHPRTQPPSSSSSAVAIANASSPSSLLHRCNTSTRAPMTHHLGPRSLTALGKQQRRALARRSIPATLVTVAGAPPSTVGLATVCVRFA